MSLNILYGLPSEGMGHATRSKVIIQYLLKAGHQVQIVTSDKAFQFLQPIFPNRVHSIEGFHLVFKESEISVSLTIWETLKKAPEKLLHNMNRYFHLMKAFSFDLVISDFESFTAMYAFIHHIPLWSIDNMQFIDRCDMQLEIPKEENRNAKMAKQIIQLKVPFAQQYLMTSFMDAPVIKQPGLIIPPIVREEIICATTAQEEHILIYQNTMKEEELVSILKHIPQFTFYVYGFNQEKEIGHIFLKAFSEKEFLHLFATAKAVMSNGGFSFLSEAVYLHKPIYTVPIPNQFEQWVNASCIQKLNYGVQSSQFEVNAILNFIEQIPFYRKHLEAYKQDGNNFTFHTIDRLLSTVQKG